MTDMLRCLLGLTLCSAAVLAQSAPEEPAWRVMKTLAGAWSADDSTGAPGQASAGGFTITPELQGHVLLRRNWALYPATAQHPSFRHEDLTLITPDGAAHYWDNEGHAIDYAVTVEDGARRIVWTSAARAGEPRFRFTYILVDASTLRLRFELAPPGQPGSFHVYVEAGAHRLQP